MSLKPTLPVAVLVGDSITQQSWTGQGLATRLSGAFVRRLDIINRGYSGFTTRTVLPIAKDILVYDGSPDQPKIKFITLFLGANDATLFGLQHVPLEEYADKLGQILDLLPPTMPKLLITPPIPDGAAWAASKNIPGLEPNRSEENTARYAQAARDVAQARANEGAELVDMWQAMDDYRSVDGQELSELLSDGLHLTEVGYKLLSDLVLNHLSSRSAVRVEDV